MPSRSDIRRMAGKIAEFPGPGGRDHLIGAAGATAIS
jgi:hypothetical protein